MTRARHAMIRVALAPCSPFSVTSDLMRESAAGSALSDEFPAARSSSRNRITGLVTRIQVDGVMAQVDLQAGPFRVVSLMSREAVEDLALEVGMLAVASVKATTVSVELPAGEG